jgi:predicted nucleic acid-binding protein
MTAGMGRTTGGASAEAVFRPDVRLARTFLDSNILVYAEDSAAPVKQKKAIDLIVEHGSKRTGVVSLQVLGEYFFAATRKIHLDPGTARSQVEFYSRFHLVEPTVSDVLAAIDLHRLHRFSYWDSLILQCAIRSGCRVLLSEDMQHGQEFNGVKIVNPFL